ncbi:MAG TPA: site-2 protease family protein, partial [Actinomycetes bacterium]|nr:site-2 protease family protein [Actinomycetes bacterium]
MMRSSFTLLRVRGIAIGAHWSWLLVFAVVVWSLAVALFPATYPGLDGGTYVAMAVVAAVLFFGSVLLHELGHAFRALEEGVQLEGITLWLLGGVARLRGQPASAWAELRVALAGPLVTLAIVAVFGGTTLLGHLLSWPGALQGVVDYLARINLLLLGFNLVPALPLDGGRVLRAWLWHRQRSFFAATRSAARAGQAFGALLVAIGILGLFTANGVGGLWFVVLGWFLLQAAQAEAAAAQVRQALHGVRVRDVMRNDPLTVSSDHTVAEFVEQARHNPRFSSYPVLDADGRLLGVMSLRQAAAVPAGQRDTMPVREAMTPAGKVVTVSPDREVFEVLQSMGDQSRRAVVVDQGRVVGVLSAGDVAHAVEAEQARGRPA